MTAATQATNQPVRRGRPPKSAPDAAPQAPAVATAGYVNKPVVSNADDPIAQPSNILLPDLGQSMQPLGEQLTMADKPLLKGQAAALAFNEEPVTIQIEPPMEDNPPTTIPVWVNGRGAEVLANGKWISLGYLPIGHVITTKRKYVEVLARSRRMNIQTVHDGTNVERPRNNIIRNEARRAVFSVLEDRNPRGHEWLRRIMAERII